jgi:hypothetical protein
LMGVISPYFFVSVLYNVSSRISYTANIYIYISDKIIGEILVIVAFLLFCYCIGCL